GTPPDPPTPPSGGSPDTPAAGGSPGGPSATPAGTSGDGTHPVVTPPKKPAFVALLRARKLVAAPRSRLVVRYVASAPARVRVALMRGATRIAAVSRRGLAGRNALVLRAPAATGRYRLALTAPALTTGRAVDGGAVTVR